jgi:hypothetical protein
MTGHAGYNGPVVFGSLTGRQASILLFAILSSMHLKRLLAAWLCAALAVPPPACAQASGGGAGASAAHAAVLDAGAAGVPARGAAKSGAATLAPDAPALLSGSLDDGAEPIIPASIAQGVFGTYGGAQSRLSGASGMAGADANASVRAPAWVPQLPDLGDGSGGALTPQAERRIGERVMREIRRDPDYIGDWLVLDYLDSVAAWLSVSAAAQFIGGYRPDFDLFAVRDGQINAFSLPGGFIGVNMGLIVATQTESELASVLGHEMGHVLQRHVARMLTQSERSFARSATESEPEQGAWWQYLAQSSAGLGDQLTQRRALAEKFALDGAWPSAIRQLKEARDMKQVGFYDLSTIDARLHDFEARYKEERAEEKDRG